jgi:hypothetical protein
MVSLDFKGSIAKIVKGSGMTLSRFLQTGSRNNFVIFRPILIKNDIFVNGEGLAIDFRWFYTPEVVFYRLEVEITLLFFDRF